MKMYSTTLHENSLKEALEDAEAIYREAHSMQHARSMMHLTYAGTNERIEYIDAVWGGFINLCREHGYLRR